MRTFLLMAFVALLVGCGNKSASNPAGAARPAEGTQAAADQPAAPAAAGAHRGQVLETMDAADYTYVRLRTAEGEIWAAGPHAAVAVGDEVNLPAGMLMQNFESKTLGRTFAQIYFVNAIETGGGAQAMPGREHIGAVMDGKAVAPGAVSPATGGRTIAQMRAARGELGGRTVQVRGKVVKISEGIMGRNWLHIQDGSAQGPEGDLTVTSSGTAKVGDIVLVSGTAAVDRDFGAGYRYDLIVEGATLTVEGQ